MSWLDRFRWQRKADAYDPLKILNAIYGSRSTKSGQTVNAETALNVTTALRCVSVIAEGIATVPLKLYRASAGGARTEARDHPLWPLLHEAPNDFQTSLEFREQLAGHVALTGNAFALVNRVGSGRVTELLPLQPAWVTVRRDANWNIFYEVRAQVATDGGQAPAIIVPASRMMHWRWRPWNGFAGMDTVRAAREAIGLALATEEQHAQLADRGMQPSGLYSVDSTLTKDQYQQLRDWIDKFEAGSTMILDRGAKFTSQGMTGVDAQHLETRRFQIEEVCRVFGVLPIMVGHSDKTATYASAESMFLAHAVHTVRPWHRRIEARLDFDLLTAKEREAGLYFAFTDTELLRGSHQARAAYYGAGIKDGWLTRNEARRFEDLDPLDGLDEPLRPLNMGPGSEPPPSDAPQDGGAAAEPPPADNAGD